MNPPWWQEAELSYDTARDTWVASSVSHMGYVGYGRTPRAAVAQMRALIRRQPVNTWTLDGRPLGATGIDGRLRPWRTA